MSARDIESASASHQLVAVPSPLAVPCGFGSPIIRRRVRGRVFDMADDGDDGDDRGRSRFESYE